MAPGTVKPYRPPDTPPGKVNITDPDSREVKKLQVLGDYQLTLQPTELQPLGGIYPTATARSDTRPFQPQPQRPLGGSVSRDLSHDPQVVELALMVARSSR